MWIRSQDKTRLLKANYIRKNGSFIEVVHSEMGCTLIGKYSTEEKALKVLDMIEQAIQENESFNCVSYSGGSYKNYKVFQMPQDEEVE